MEDKENSTPYEIAIHEIGVWLSCYRESVKVTEQFYENCLKVVERLERDKSVDIDKVCEYMVEQVEYSSKLTEWQNLTKPFEVVDKLIKETVKYDLEEEN